MEDLNTEKKILEAAKAVFIEKGKDGTSMQSIADRAGINKALLHYYFRSKDKLFMTVLEGTLFKFLPQLEHTFLSNIDIFEKIRIAVREYINLLTDNPYIPAFMIIEMNRNPNGLFELLTKSGIRIDLVFKHIQNEIVLGNIKNITPHHFFLNLLSLCIFPFAARPLMQRALFKNDSKAYDQFIEERKTQTAEFIINAIKA